MISLRELDWNTIDSTKCLVLLSFWYMDEITYDYDDVGP